MPLMDMQYVRVAYSQALAEAVNYTTGLLKVLRGIPDMVAKQGGGT